MHRLIAVAGAVWLLLASTVSSQPIEQANAAAIAGDFAKAERLLQPSANSGSAIAQLYLGLTYALDRDGAPDWVRAAAWLRRSADQGNVKAQVSLAMLYYASFPMDDPPRNPYLNPPVGSQDQVQAYQWLKLAADADSGDDARQDAIFRDRASANLSVPQREAADRWVSEWRPVAERSNQGPVNPTSAQALEDKRFALEWQAAPITFDRAERWMPNGDIEIGSPDAKMTIIEYVGAACPQCARFNDRVFPQLRAKYIDTGMVRMVFREMPLAMAGFNRAGLMLARCAGRGRYLSVLNAIYHGRFSEALPDHDLSQLLWPTAEAAGFNPRQIQACLNNKTAQAEFTARTDILVKANHITSAPTFVIGDRTLIGYQTLSQIEDALSAARAGQ